MSFLRSVTTGVQNANHFVLIYGDDGIGKSTFAADAPAPIFICAETGTNHLNVARFARPSSFKEVLGMVDELLATDELPYRTLAIDSLDWLEPLVWEEVCKEGGKSNIKRFGYGEGYTLANQKWKSLIDRLQKLRSKMHVVLIGHARRKEFNDPQQILDYSRFELKLQEQAAGIFREAVDAVLFANFETHVKKDEDTGKVKAFGDGVRLVFTERRPSHDAKNRLGLPYTMPLSWEVFEEKVKIGSPDSPEAIKNRIVGLVSLSKDPKIKERIDIAIAECEKSKNWKRLAQIENQLKTMTGES